MAMRLKGWFAAMLVGMLAARAAAAAGPWDAPAAALTAQIAGQMGPGQAQLMLRNLSSIANGDLPAIRRLLIQDLKVHGITVSGAESANTVRITLSETAHERLWVSEVVQGNETQVAMVRTILDAQHSAPAAAGLVLRRQQIFISHEPVLAAAELPDSLILVGPEQIAIEQRTTTGWQTIKSIPIGQRRPLPRDPRGVIVADTAHFDARVAGMQCTGSFLGAWAIACHESDDPWPLVVRVSGVTLSAFYNGARNSFTGVVTPSIGIDLPAFYDAALLPRPAGNAALLVGGIDGKAQIAESGALKDVSGARDWGSDFAAIDSGCGMGVQVVASGSGAAANDSLRAYELPALEAVPASTPLTVNGTVMALSSAPDAKSVYAIVHDADDMYEVDRVTALCN